MLPYLLAHAPQIIAAVVAGGGYFAFRLWQANGYKLPAWRKSSPPNVTLNDDLQMAIGLLSRAKARASALADADDRSQASATATAMASAVQLLVTELTA